MQPIPYSRRYRVPSGCYVFAANLLRRNTPAAIPTYTGYMIRSACFDGETGVPNDPPKVNVLGNA